MPFTRSDEYHDHQRDVRDAEWRPSDPFAPVDPKQITAVNRLLGHCEGLCASGTLGTETERRLRERIAETLTAFRLPSLAELNADRSDEPFPGNGVHGG